jgi:NRPS condensation-like uncharacterized protein
MKRGKRVEWTRLDNAAKIFPPTSNYKDTKVFRFVCELQEEVNPDILQLALDETIENFPLYKSVLRKGVFWYYLESSNIHPTVELESRPICERIYFEGQRNLLFRVLYYKNRINVEIFHALSDGAGALWFVKTLVYHYLIKKYKEVLGDIIPKLNYDASISQKMDDSFLKHYTKRKLPKREKQPRAYHIHETRREENRYKLVEGTMSVKEVLEVAHEYNTTLTVYLTALFMYSICKGMPARRKNRPVVLSVPVNLRNYFESESARNFFSTINVGFHFGKNKINIEEVIESVSDSFKRELEEERLLVHLNRLASLEQNGLIRIVPLPIKDMVLKLANQIAERSITSSISNVGKITVAEELKPFIKQFSVFTSARRPQIAICSYEDKLVISFTSPYNETDIQKTFFQTLSHKGIDVKIVTNL